MKIILMRHGQPQIHLESMKNKRVSAFETGQMIRAYEFADLDFSQKPLDDALTVAQNNPAIFSSDILRAQSSISMLGVSLRAEVNACFRESDHPYIEWHSPKLKFFTWCILFRLAWLVGFSKNGEALRTARQRAQIGADKLIDAARQEGSVMLLGHGIFNRLIVSKLKKQGWLKTGSTGYSYWSYIVIEKA